MHERVSIIWAYLFQKDNAQNHWLTLTNINPNAEGTWLIYDSLNDANYIQHWRYAFRKICPDQNTFFVQTVNVVKQKDYTDCGLFAIAYLVAIIHKKDPAKLCFYQHELRQHFNFSLKSGTWNEFPHEYVTTSPTYTQHEINLGDIPVNW